MNSRRGDCGRPNGVWTAEDAHAEARTTPPIWREATSVPQPAVTQLRTSLFSDWRCNHVLGECMQIAGNLRDERGCERLRGIDCAKSSSNSMGEFYGADNRRRNKWPTLAKYEEASVFFWQLRREKEGERMN